VRTGPPRVPCVLLFRGRGTISAAIRWQTRSQYSHAALYTPEGHVLEAWQGEGVRVTVLTDWSNVDAFGVAGMTEAHWYKACEWARTKVGHGYDYWAVCRFVSRRLMPANDNWFCSELVFSALLHAGVAPLMRINAAEVSPGLLACSPLLYPL